ncbi:MAG: DUF4398 domain-containing protein [Methylophilaceae bacterium]|nr:DUF4398 domain-containing protein [Methylophilaceae bacterium]
MKKFNRIRSFQGLPGISLAAATLLLVAGCASAPAPLEQIAVSKAAVSSATSAGGNEFAPVTLQSARDKLAAAERALADKNYALAKQLAEESLVDSKLAAATARSAKAQKAAKAVQEDNRILQQEIERKSK